MPRITFVTDEAPTPERVQSVIRNLVAFNEQVAPPEHREAVAVFAAIGDRLVGGVVGFTHWNWLFVSHLWVAEDERLAGVGTHLMSRIEHVAIRRGGIGAHLDTFDFQALPFYERIGYSVFGSLPDYPPGHNRNFLMKRSGRSPRPRRGPETSSVESRFTDRRAGLPIRAARARRSTSGHFGALAPSGVPGSRERAPTWSTTLRPLIPARSLSRCGLRNLMVASKTTEGDRGPQLLLQASHGAVAGAGRDKARRPLDPHGEAIVAIQSDDVARAPGQSVTCELLGDVDVYDI
jgi:GNAT superfamily N-acetyltransferase